MSVDTVFTYPFTYGGGRWRSSNTNIRVFREDTDLAPAINQQAISIPGRSGDLIVDDGTYRNIDMVYNLIFYTRNEAYTSDIESVVQEVKWRLLSGSGYKRLQDIIYPDEYYMAAILEDIVTVFSPDRKYAKMRVVFNRKPQRFLTTDEEGITLNYRSDQTAQSFRNAGRMPSRPRLQVWGAGVITLNEQTITITDVDEYTMIDSEIMDCYKGSVSKNAFVQFSDNEFPVLKTGSNSIILGSGITSVTIIPRWWRL